MIIEDSLLRDLLEADSLCEVCSRFINGECEISEYVKDFEKICKESREFITEEEMTL